MITEDQLPVGFYLHHLLTMLVIMWLLVGVSHVSHAVPGPDLLHSRREADVLAKILTENGNGRKFKQGENGTRSWSPPAQQEKLMAKCIELAKEAVAAGGSPYGALIADPSDGSVV